MSRKTQDMDMEISFRGGSRIFQGREVDHGQGGVQTYKGGIDPGGRAP